jgi:hypothetical protein
MLNYCSGRLSIPERAAHFLLKVAPAVAGSRGHNTTYAAAQAMVNGFALDKHTALELLLLYYNPRCSPRWSESELRHKVDSSLANPGTRARGYMLRDGEDRRATGLPGFVKSAQQSARAQKKREGEQLGFLASERLPHILSSLPWSASQIYSDSPGGMLDDPEEDWRLALSLFRPDETLWIGDTKESGSAHHAGHFRTAVQWLTEVACPKGPFILPAPLKPGVWTRTKLDVVRVPFLVVESDKLGKDEIGAVFRWLREGLGLALCAVVDTGSRSLHGWFARPDPETLHELRAVLPALSCDGAVLRDTQPVRLPGCLRPGKFIRQALLYFDREVAR